MQKVMLLMFSVFPGSLLAHEGHGAYQNSWLHYIASGWHLATVLAVMLVVFWIVLNRSYHVGKKISK